MGSMERRTSALRLLTLGAAWLCMGAAPAPGDLVAAWRLGGEPLVLTSRPQDAGAISSLVFRGQQFVASRENGWLLQGAAGFGFWGECLNPTLAGGRYDPPGTTSSRRLSAHVDAHSYAITTRMAYWTPPGRRCSDSYGTRRIAADTTVLSDTIYAQTLTPGFRGVADAIDDHVVISTPARWRTVGFEVLTGYLPPEFSRVYAYGRETRRLEPLADKDLPTERYAPEVVSTRDGRFAMGILAISPLADAHYAALRTRDVTKWSLVYHYTRGLEAGPHRFECVVLLGSRDGVLRALRRLSARADLALLRKVAASALVLLAAVAGVTGWAAARGRRPLRPLA